jgi:omega-6 fatty acid desaturase (delta-12 desaturase)
MTTKQSLSQATDPDDIAWIHIVKKYNEPDKLKSIWQIISSFGPFLLLWYLMYLSLDTSYWITLGLAFPTAGFLVRMFIIFHDCGHGSFFKSKKVNKIVGTILGSLCFTPYDRWHKDHAIHHATVGNLDERGIGDVWTLTAREYAARSAGKRFVYRLYRNPFILFGISPFFLFVVLFRFTNSSMTRAERWSVYITNLILLVLAALLSLLIGFKSFLMVQLPIIYIAAVAGVWLFYLQHQFDNVIWSRKEDWDYKTMALEGSSYVKFPKILQWFSGNIGFHHIHHLSPKIPNYKLEKCHRENKLFEQVQPVRFLSSLRTMRLKLWNEQRGQLVGFREF